ncbi:ribonuclease H-like domain-containing protein [Tanacetum coccineum]
MLIDSKLPTTFWAEAVNTACYVQNRVITVKPHNKTPYELFRGRTPALSFMRPFRCHVSYLNTLDHLGKFDGKFDDGFFVGYSLTSKAFRVYNIRIRRVEENLHIRFLEDKPIVSGYGPKWLFDLDSLTKSMNYVPVIIGINSNDFAGSENDDGVVSKASEVDDQERPESSTLNINTVGPIINTASANPRNGSLHINTAKHIEYLMLNASPLKHVKRDWDTKIPQFSGPSIKVGDEAVHKELGDRMEKAATTASNLEAE